MCVIDWGLIAAYLQVLAIVGTGTAAIVVANRQLRAFVQQLRDSNANERIKNTLEYIALYDQLTYKLGVDEEPVSLHIAMSYVTSLLRVPGQLSVFREFLRTRPLIALNQPAPPLLILSNALINVSNYFTRISLLLYRRRLDKALLLDIFAPRVIILARILESVRNDAPWVQSMLAFGEFQTLIADANGWISKHPEYLTGELAFLQSNADASS